MDSSPSLDMASSSPGGVATMPPSSMRSLISASQGPQPLSNVFTYSPRPRSHRMHPLMQRFPEAGRAPVLVHSASATLAVGGMTEGSHPREDERKPPPRENEDVSSEDCYGMPSLVARARSTSDDDSMPHLSRTVRSSSDDDSMPHLSRRSIPAASLPPPPPRRSCRKRRSATQACDINAAKPPPAKRVKHAPPHKAMGNLKSDPDDSADAGSCCICMCDPDDGEASVIDGCEHQFCFECIDTWSDRENTCPLCKKRFTRINRVSKTRAAKGAKGKKNTKKVKQRDQRADLTQGSALEGLLAGLHANTSGFSPAIARLIFSGGPQGGVIDFGTASDASNRRSSAAGRSFPRRSIFLSGATRAGSHFEDSLLLQSDDEDEGSEDEIGNLGFTTFVNQMRQMHQNRSRAGFGNGIGILGGFPASPPRSRFSIPMAAPQPPSRSYATNGHVANVGVSADNALEIDDDSDDEVEVVSVRAAGRI